MIKVGQKVRFDPYKDMRSYGMAMIRGDVTGEVVSVYPEHRYFTAEYKAGDKKFKISFKFDDVYGPDKCVSIAH